MGSERVELILQSSFLSLQQLDLGQKVVDEKRGFSGFMLVALKTRVCVIADRNSTRVVTAPDRFGQQKGEVVRLKGGAGDNVPLRILAQTGKIIKVGEGCPSDFTTFTCCVSKPGCM